MPVITSFDEIEMPRELAREIQCITRFGVEEEEGGQSGFDQSNIIRPIPRRAYQGAYLTSTDAELYEKAMRFYYGRLGAYPFRLYDWGDHKHDDGGGVGKVLYRNMAWRLYKVYEDELRAFERPVIKAISGISIPDFPGATVDLNTGIVTGVDEECEWLGEFHTPVKFTTEGCTAILRPRSNDSHIVELRFSLIEKILPPPYAL